MDRSESRSRPAAQVATVTAALVGLTGLAEIMRAPANAGDRIPRVGEQVVYVADGSGAPGEVVDVGERDGAVHLSLVIGGENVVADPGDVRFPTPLLGF